jgi:hypothetical protein|tara:strand:- start:246 stop:788 length:543 start_codon:yes stop_codon:yes gene_type:complete
MKETLKRKRRLTLNTDAYWGRAYGKKHKKKDHENFHYRGEIKIVGKETNMQECKECCKILSITAYTTAGIRADGAWYCKKMCRQCATIVRDESRIISRNAPPKPERCDCCHKKMEKLNADHVHGSFVFRGWLCKACNTGMGLLGDNLKGILQAVIFLENDTNKIIETLHKISNKMFARTK